MPSYDTRWPLAAGPDLRAALDRRTPLIGTFASLPSPVSIEVLAHVGFDVLCIDGEHSALGPGELESLVRATVGGAAAPIVRVGMPGPEVAHALDAGAVGVVFPRVDSAATATECAAWTRYPPLGKRGAGPGRASGYGASSAEYLPWANDHVVAIVQIETFEGLEAADEIAAVDLVDAVFVGPNDLAVSLGTARGSAEHLAAIDRILAAAERAGKATGILCSPSEVGAWLNKGVSLLLVRSDIALLRGAAITAFALADEAREHHD